MSFDLTDAPLLWVPVTWPMLKPGPDDGIAIVEEARIDVLVEIVDRDELKAIFYAEDGAEQMSDFDGFKRIVRDWRKVMDGNSPVPFTDENIEKILRVPSFPNALQTAYLKACNGSVAVREGNSESSPPVGRAGGRSRKTPAGRR